MSFEVREEALTLADGSRIVALALQDGSGRRLLAAPAMGANVLSWQEPVLGKTIELLWQDFAALDQASAIKQGIPILFPFANRIRHGRFRWGGRDWSLPLNCPKGEHAIHGSVWQTAMHVEESQASEREAAVTLSGDGNADPSRWPGAAALKVTLRLRAGAMIQEFKVINCSGEGLPFSFGTHPYWRLNPETSRVCVNRDAKQVTVWDLKECLPHGGRLPARGKYAKLLAATSRPLGSDRFDDILHVAGAVSPTWTMDSGEGWKLELQALGGFRDYVVFTPPHRQAVCLEPYTAVTDAINLHARGLDTGLIVLAPGEAWQGSITVKFWAT